VVHFSKFRTDYFYMFVQNEITPWLIEQYKAKRRAEVALASASSTLGHQLILRVKPNQRCGRHDDRRSSPRDWNPAQSRRHNGEM
jgi:hypothetical protein